MPSTAIASGVLLILIGIIGYIVSVMDEKTSLTALIPAAFGLLLVICGVIARSKESLRKHLMHVAVVVGLLGFILPTARLVSRIREINASPAILLQAAMAAVCLVFVVLCIKSFINARRNRMI